MCKDAMLGVLLVHTGVLSQQELDTALSAQRSRREHNPAAHAMAVADLALSRRRRQTLLSQRQRIAQKGASIVRSISDNYVAITSDLINAMAKGRNE
jgi:hypothetical protein